MKTCDIVYLSCVAAWDVFKSIMDNNDSKSHFLSCKLQQLIFTKCVLIYVQSNEKYSGMPTVKCEKNDIFEIILQNVSENFFNMMAKNFVLEKIS